MNEPMEGCALCALGLEKVLAKEISRIGLDPTSRLPGRVFFAADLKGLFRANLELRTAERVLVVANRFSAPDFDALFEGARRPAWHRFFSREDRLVIERVRSRESALNSQTAVQSIVHKAIYESLSKTYGLTRLPETGRVRSLRVYLEHDECVLGLDLSGEALHRRGWRKAAGEAPIKETVAAGLLLLAGWRRKLPLLDPFCGSGTFLIEAAHFAIERAPGLDRHFDIETMPLIREGAAADFADERARARAAIRKDVELAIVGCDSDPQAMDWVRGNAARAGVAPYVEVSTASAETIQPIAESGLIITNPPWGSRMGTVPEARSLFARIGAAWGLADSGGRRSARRTGPFGDWSIGLVSNDASTGTDLGRRAPVEYRILNGSEEHWFHFYPAARAESRAPSRDSPR